MDVTGESRSGLHMRRRRGQVPNKVPPTYNLERNYSTESIGKADELCNRQGFWPAPAVQPRSQKRLRGRAGPTELKGSQGIGEGFSPPREDRLDHLGKHRRVPG